MNKRFKIVMASYDCFDYIERSVRSVDEQTYTNYDVCVVDDATPDERQRDFLRAWCDERPNWTLIQHDHNTGAMESQYDALVALQPEDQDVIVWVDGDDRLNGHGALRYLNHVYRDFNPLMTYGSYISDPFSETCAPAKPYPPECAAMNDYRNAYKWGIQFNHLRTITGLLYNKLDPRVDFKWRNGEFFRVSADAAIMLPCLEMAGPDRIKVIKQPLYVYSSDNPISEWRKANKETLLTHDYIFKLPKKDRL